MRFLPGIPLVLVLCATPGAAAQGLVQPTTTVDRAQVGSQLGDTDRAPWDVGGWVRTPAGAFTTSLVLPGAAQAAFGARRWAVYGALELAVWTLRIRSQGEHRDATAAYRELAWEVARLQGEHPRRDGSWGYYETMTQYVRSGAFDRDPLLDGVQPEPDPDTYNGAVWTLARARAGSALELGGERGRPGTVPVAHRGCRRGFADRGARSWRGSRKPPRFRS